MMGVLLIRVLTELMSAFWFSRIDLGASAQIASRAVVRFYQFRSRIHGWFTIFLVALYTLGFYLLTPEFSIYFSLPTMILIDGSYLIGAIPLIWYIGRKIKQEKQELEQLTMIYKEIT